MEDAMATVEELEKDVRQAKSESARNKEESKSVRKRLAGCHYHYRQLQQQYDSCLKEKNDLERLYSKALRYEGLRKIQEESWCTKMEDLREKRRMAEADVSQLKQENLELHSHCNELLAAEGASKSVDTISS
jgi:chromosome segregation ATPase